MKRLEPDRDQSSNGGQPRVVLPMSKIFDAIDEGHKTILHLGEERTYEHISKTNYSVTQALCTAYCKTCQVCNAKQPTIAPHKGAKRPIHSQNFRDRYQIDLIDMRKMQKRDVYGVMQRWILTVKDHFTGLTHVTSIPRKRAKYVAFELDKLFGFIGYPAIFHTDNGKEFTAHEIITLLRLINPRILTVTGRPRTPRDQGSVESMNKLIESVLHSVETQIRMEGMEPNWTRLLGRVMAAINNQSSRQANSVSAYSTVFGMAYDQSISCSRKDALKCYTIEERLNISHDERLAKVAGEICIIHEGNKDVVFDPDRVEDSGYWSDNSNPLNSDGEEEGEDVRDSLLEAEAGKKPVRIS